MQRLNDILKDIKVKASAEAVLLSSSDGLVLDAVQDDGLDLESLAAYAASNITASERLGESAQCGVTESVIIIYQGKALVMTPLGPVVAMLLGSGAQLGNLRLQLKRAMPNLSAALETELDLSLATAQPPVASVQAPVPATPAREAAPVVQPEPAPEPEVEPPPQPPSADPELNGNGRRPFTVSLQRSSINLR